MASCALFQIFDYQSTQLSLFFEGYTFWNKYGESPCKKNHQTRVSCSYVHKITQSLLYFRYIHICHHHMYGRIYTFRNTSLMCVGLWCVSFLAEMPNFLGWGDHVYDRKTLSCVWDRTAAVSYSLFFSCVGVAFPVILISICYAMIYKHVLDSKRKVKAMKVTGQVVLAVEKENESQKQSRQLARTLFIIFIVFAVCWTPYAFMVSLDVNDTFPQELHIFSILIAHTNSSLNSVLYGISNKHFRYAYFRLLGLRRFIPDDRANQKEASVKTITVAEKSIQ